MLNSLLQVSKDYLDSIQTYGLKRIPHISLQLTSVRSNDSQELDMCNPVLSYGLIVEGTTEPYKCTSLQLSFFRQDTGSSGLLLNHSTIIFLT